MGGFGCRCTKTVSESRRPPEALVREGWQGWDEYAPFYDWENARTLGRRDVPFWRRVALQARRAGAGARLRHRPRLAAARARRRRRSSASIDRRRCSRARAAQPRSRAAAAQLASRRSRLVRGDIRALPFAAGAFSMVLAPVRHPAVAARATRDLDGDARRRSRACSRPAARSASISCPTCRTGASTTNRVQLRGRAAGGAHLTLVESVRQDPTRRLTTFEQTLRRAPRRQHARAPLRADVPHAVGAADDAPARAGRVRGRRGARRLSRPPVGRARRRLDHPGEKECKIFASVSRCFFWEFSTCPAIPSGPRSSTRRAPLDAKRGKIFTRLIKELTVAARAGGGDPDMNPRLRTIIADAKAANMPADNIKRAIRRGTGEEPGVSYEEAQYEAYGPGGAAVIIDVLTDNKNRTVGELRHMLEKHGGNLAADQRRRLDVHQEGLHRRREGEGRRREADGRGARRRRRRPAGRRRQLGSAERAGGVRRRARRGEGARHRAGQRRRSR